MLSVVDKTKILGYLNSTEISDLSYDAMCRLLRKKYRYVDFIDYFTKTILANLNKEKFSTKLIKKLIVSTIYILDICTHSNEKINSSIVNEILSIFPLYQKLITSKSASIDEELTKMIDELKEKVPQIIEMTPEEIPASEPNDDLFKTLAELRASINDKESELAKMKSSNIDLTKSIKDKRRKIIELETSLEESLKELEKLHQELTRLINENNILISNNASLTKENNSLNTRIKSLKAQTTAKEKEPSTESIQTLKNEFKRVRKELEEKLEALKQELDEERSKSAGLENAREEYRLKYKSAFYESDRQKKLAKRELKIEEAILEALFIGECSAYTLIEILKKRNYDITVEELIEHILHLKRKLNIEIVGLDVNNPVFKITSPLIKKGGIFNFTLKDNNKPLKIVSVADAHIRDFINNSFIDNYKRLLDYCDQNEADMIIGLGDFFDYAYGHKDNFTKEEFERISDMVLDAIEKIPLSPIMHLILGGNHEQDTLHLGVDFLKYFAEHRSDFMFLGYDYADLTFRRKGCDKLRILVAHPNVGVKSDTKSVFGQKFSDYDFSLLGHSHRNKIYLTQSACQVTTWGKVNHERGAMATDMYFDETGLTSIDLKPLILKRELKPATIINYTKPQNK